MNTYHFRTWLYGTKRMTWEQFAHAEPKVKEQLVYDYELVWG